MSTLLPETQAPEKETKTGGRRVSDPAIIALADCKESLSPLSDHHKSLVVDWLVGEFGYTPGFATGANG